MSSIGNIVSAIGVAQSRRKVGHLPRIGDQAAVVLMRQLLGAKRRQAQLRDGGRATVLVEVGQVPRRLAGTRLGEDQLLNHDLSSIGHVRAGLGNECQHRPGRDRRRAARRRAGPSGRRGRAAAGPCP